MDAADGALEVEPRRIAAKPRDHSRRTDERDVAVEREPARPPRQPRHRLEPAVRRDTHLAVAGALDPELPAVKAGGMRAGEPAHDRLAGPAREDDSTPVDREVPVPRPARRDPVGRRRVERGSGVRAGRDRVQLQVVPGKIWAVLRLDRLRPPDALRALPVEPDDSVLADR